MSVRHIGGQEFFNPSPKRHKSVNAAQVRGVVKQQFMMNKHVTDSKKLEELKNAALRALTNYVMHLSQSLHEGGQSCQTVFSAESIGRVSGKTGGRQLRHMLA